MKNKEEHDSNLKIKRNLKLIIIIAITIILSSFISVFAYSYFAKDITYSKSDGTKISVENALNELYNEYDNNLSIYESGSYSAYIPYGSQYRYVNITLKKNYTEEDNAKLVITQILPKDNAMYYSANSLSYKIVGNQLYFTLLNFAGDSRYSTTYTVNYDIVRYNN